MPKTKHIVIVAPHMTSILDVAGPLDVFTKAMYCLNEIKTSSNDLYKTHIVSVDTNTVVQTSSGLPIVCEGALESVNYEIDTLLIAGKGNLNEITQNKLIKWLKHNDTNVRRIGSICEGTFLLAEAGLLNKKRATTHWRSCDKLHQLYPDVIVESDPIYIKDGHIYTSAGISTGIDLSLALVEEDFGREIALMVARILVLYLKRTGNQSQFSSILMHQSVEYEPIKLIQDWIINNLDKVLTVEVLAEKASMSPRNFARVFLRETGITPAKYVEKLRLETARRRLEETHLTLEEISNECGIGSADNLRRVFIRHLRTTPSDYRRSFTTALA